MYPTEPKKPQPMYVDGLPTGPLREQTGPHDHEGAGRARFWDTPEAQRTEQVARMLELTKAFSAAQDQQFAKGWLSELERVNAAKTRKAAR